jgi:hypothetical protein
MAKVPWVDELIAVEMVGPRTWSGQGTVRRLALAEQMGWPLQVPATVK